MAAGLDKKRTRQVDGILLLDKPVGVSSNQALQIVRRALNAAKAGHTGNLDVAASGLLPLCFGEATKICGFLLDSNKRYHAEVQLGQTSTSGDREGELTRPVPVTVTQAEIENALTALRGKISQIPPMHSALKRNGQPLYKLARRGIEVERQPRIVEISELVLVHYTEDRIGLDIACSKGTYIRSLAMSVGEILGCGAYLAALRRIEAGPFTIIRAYPLDLFQDQKYRAEDYDDLLLPIDSALDTVPRVSLNQNEALLLKLGQSLRLTNTSEYVGLTRIYGHDDEFIGMGTMSSQGLLAPKRLTATSTGRETTKS